MSSLVVCILKSGPSGKWNISGSISEQYLWKWKEKFKKTKRSNKKEETFRVESYQSEKKKKERRKQKESLSKFLIHFSADMHPEEKLVWSEKANEGGRKGGKCRAT